MNKILKELYKTKVICEVMETCDDCEFYLRNDNLCRIVDAVGTEPKRWKITKPKTYLDDFLEKFPEAKLNENFISLICLKDLYSTTIDCDAVKDCEHCWNLIMEGE